MAKDKRKGKGRNRGRRPASEAASFLRKLHDPNRTAYGILVVLDDIKKFSIPVITNILRVGLRSPAIKIAVLPSPFPAKYQSLLPDAVTRTSENIEQEVKWLISLLLCFTDRLNAFVPLMEEFEAHYLRGEYGLARNCIEKIEGEFGFSLWSIQATLLLADTEGGLERNFDTKNKIRKALDSRLSNAIVAYIGVRTESALSVDNYDSELEKLFEEENLPIWDYLRFRINFHRFADFDESRLINILRYDTVAPIIDRYLTLIRVLQIILSKDPKLPETKLIAEHICHLGSVVNDPILINLCNLLGCKSTFRLPVCSDDNMRAIDAYTVGDYKSALALSNIGIRNKPNSMELYEIKSKAELYDKNASYEAEKSINICEEIVGHLSNIFSRNQHIESSLLAILAHAYRLDGLRIGLQLYAIYLEYKFPRHTLNGKMLFGAAATSTPRISLLFDSVSEAITYLERLKLSSPSHSITTTLFIEIIQSALCNEENDFSMRLPLERRLKYKGVLLERRQCYERAFGIYKELESIQETAPMVRNDAQSGMYRCALRLSRVMRCIEIAVAAYLENNNLLSSSDVVELISRYESFEQAPQNVSPLIPVLYYMRYVDSGRRKDADSLFDAYENFLHANCVERPGQLRPIMSSFDNAKIIFFLRYICIQDIMDSSVSFCSPQDLDEERISICELLREIDSPNESYYSTEISDIRKKEAIRKAIATADKSKIYVDTLGIRNSLESSAIDTFQRFVRIMNIPEDKRATYSIALQEGKVIIFAHRDEGLQIFKGFFTYIKDRFVSNSEYCLDVYLSVRIRHGSLAGQLRSHFERHKLVTRKNSETGLYEANDYWKKCLEGEILLSSLGDLLHRLESFSKEIDDTIETVKSEWIQLKSDKKPNGYFDYEFDEFNIFRLYLEVKENLDLNASLDLIFSFLWDKTKENLKRLRIAIGSELTHSLTNALDSLRTDTENIGLRSGTNPNLLNEIAKCRTEIQHELEIISNWFQVSGGDKFADFEPRLAIDTTLELVQRTFPFRELRPKLSINSSSKIKGDYFPSFLDIFYILLENIVKHSKPNYNESMIGVNEGEKKLVIAVENELLPADIQRLSNQVVDLQDRANHSKSTGMASSEGGTGFYKLGKILKHDLKNFESNVTIEIRKKKYFRVTVTINFA